MPPFLCYDRKGRCIKHLVTGRKSKSLNMKSIVSKLTKLNSEHGWYPENYLAEQLQLLCCKYIFIYIYIYILGCRVCSRNFKTGVIRCIKLKRGVIDQISGVISSFLIHSINKSPFPPPPRLYVYRTNVFLWLLHLQWIKDSGSDQD